jgi:branched-chain amino acid transport system substrate-binding protein
MEESSMRLARRSLLAAAASAAVLPTRHSRAQAKPVIRIGVMNDMSGPYRDVNGPTGVICAKQAVQEFAAGGFDVEVLSADHQNKPDVAASTSSATWRRRRVRWPWPRSAVKRTRC